MAITGLGDCPVCKKGIVEPAMADIFIICPHCMMVLLAGSGGYGLKCLPKDWMMWLDGEQLEQIRQAREGVRAVQGARRGAEEEGR